MIAPRIVQRRFPNFHRPYPPSPFVSRFFWFIGIMAFILGIIAWAGKANAADRCAYDNDGRVTCMGSPPAAGKFARSHRSRTRVAIDANGNAATVRSSSGIAVRVSPAARAALQCVVNYVESAGVKIKAMRGYGPGTVRASLHPGGKALDINQTARDVTHPAVPRDVSNAAADHCGVISGARWGYADNGHWNLTVTGQPTEPWPRVVKPAVIQ